MLRPEAVGFEWLVNAGNCSSNAHIKVCLRWCEPLRQQRWKLAKHQLQRVVMRIPHVPPMLRFPQEPLALYAP